MESVALTDMASVPYLTKKALSEPSLMPEPTVFSAARTLDALSGQNADQSVPIHRAQSMQNSSTTVNVLGYPYENMEQFYELDGNILGEGVVGSVRRCKSRLTGELYACKSILKSSLVSPSDYEGLRMEVEAMTAVKGHPGIVRLQEVFEDSKAVHLIMEFCEGGDLFDCVRKVGRLSERNAARIVRILISVVQHCNAKGIAHRDLKPENILLVSKQSHSLVKVADFGHAVFYSPGRELTRGVGTGYYIAPEVLDRSYGPEIDMWSIGVVLYVLLAGRPPFMAQDTPGVFSKIKAGVYDMETGVWPGVSQAAKHLISRLLCQDPQSRATVDEVKKHPWILYHSSLRPAVAALFKPISEEHYSMACSVETNVEDAPGRRQQGRKRATANAALDIVGKKVPCSSAATPQEEKQGCKDAIDAPRFRFPMLLPFGRRIATATK